MCNIDQGGGQLAGRLYNILKAVAQLQHWKGSGALRPRCTLRKIMPLTCAALRSLNSVRGLPRIWIGNPGLLHYCLSVWPTVAASWT
jgi:hypothetical protein